MSFVDLMIAGFLITAFGQVAVIVTQFQYFSSSNVQNKDRSYWQAIQLMRREKPLLGNLLLWCFVLMYPFGILAALSGKIGL